MDSPFRSWYEGPAQQRRSYSFHPSRFGVPVYPVDPTRQALHSAYADRQPPADKKSGRKVVQIPVQFFDSDSDRRWESALRIQKVFRGFFVRKSVKKIKEIKAQVNEIEARLLRDEVVEMVRGNERERLRMSESLMNLLLRLDGIRGFDFGIRVCRKVVTRKAIELQEKIDAICVPDSVDDKVEIGSREVEAAVPEAEFVGIEVSPGENPQNSDYFEEIPDDSGEESKRLNGAPLECEKMEELDVVIASGLKTSEETHVEDETETTKNFEFSEDHVEGVKEMLVQYNGEDMINEAGKDDDAIENCEFLANSGVPVTSARPVQGTPRNLDFDEDDAETVKEIILACCDDCGEKLCDFREELKDEDTLEVEDKTWEVEREPLGAESVDVLVDVVKASQEINSVKHTRQNLDLGAERAEITKETSVERNGVDMGVTEKEDLDKRKCELLEQMMEENKKMMLLMSQLNERNETQLQMLDALTNRVEWLEKAYLCDKLRNSRRKKTKKNKVALTCIED